jgi:hypothetical protein
MPAIAALSIIDRNPGRTNFRSIRVRIFLPQIGIAFSPASTRLKQMKPAYRFHHPLQATVSTTRSSVPDSLSPRQPKTTKIFVPTASRNLFSGRQF